MATNLLIPVQGTASRPCGTTGSAFTSSARSAASAAGASVAGVMSAISDDRSRTWPLRVEQAGFFLALGAVSQQFHGVLSVRCGFNWTSHRR